MKAPDLEAARQDYLNFLGRRRTITLATLDGDGLPAAAIVPFVLSDNKFYVYVSEIADHYDQLVKSPQVMVMLHADESETKNLWAVERARFRCTATQLENEGYEAVFDQLRAQHNSALIDVLLGLDFHLFELAPTDGRYVVGFGKAFDIDLPATKFEHVVIDKKAA